MDEQKLAFGWAAVVVVVVEVAVMTSLFVVEVELGPAVVAVDAVVAVAERFRCFEDAA